jgi:hypothetical protein
MEQKPKIFTQSLVRDPPPNPNPSPNAHPNPNPNPSPNSSPNPSPSPKQVLDQLRCSGVIEAVRTAAYVP